MIKKYLNTDCCAEKINELIDTINKQEKELYDLQKYVFKLTNKKEIDKRDFNYQYTRA